MKTVHIYIYIHIAKAPVRYNCALWGLLNYPTYIKFVCLCRFFVFVRVQGPVHMEKSYRDKQNNI